MNDSHFKAWILPALGAPLRLEERNMPEVNPAGVLVRIESAMVLSYMEKVLNGSTKYAIPQLPFVPGTNAIGVVHSVGADVSHVAKGDRVFLSPRLIINEFAESPSQILIGLTAMGASRFDGIPEDALRLQNIWRDGVFAELAHWPASCVTPLHGLNHIPSERLIALAKLIVPYGGLLRAGLRPGQTVAINGATGFYGSAGVMVALAMGAAPVIVIGRNGTALNSLAKSLGPRVKPAIVSGADAQKDASAIQAATDGAVDVALDLLGAASSTTTTLATLRSLRRGGRLVIMGSASVPLEVNFGEMLSNDWEVVGNFMYPNTAVASLANLIASGQLDLSPIRLRRYAFVDLPQAITAATSMKDLDLTVIETLSRK